MNGVAHTERMETNPPRRPPSSANIAVIFSVPSRGDALLGCGRL
jgi:hypothetical protein